MVIVAAMIVALIIAGLTVADIGKSIGEAICKITSGQVGQCGGEGPGEDPNEIPPYGGPGSQGADPGDDVDYPEGLDPNSSLARELASTPRGRRLLQWLADNGVPIVMDPGQVGAVYRNGRIVLGPGTEDVSTVVHEANHAVWDKEGRNLDPKKTGRQAYIDNQILGDATSSWLSMVIAKEQREAGADVPKSIAEERYDRAYQPVFDAAIAAGKSKAEAHRAADQAGLDAIVGMYHDGTFVTSNTGDSYAVYWGKYWDSVN